MNKIVHPNKASDAKVSLVFLFNWMFTGRHTTIGTRVMPITGTLCGGRGNFGPYTTSTPCRYFVSLRHKIAGKVFESLSKALRALLPLR